MKKENLVSQSVELEGAIESVLSDGDLTSVRLRVITVGDPAAISGAEQIVKLCGLLGAELSGTALASALACFK